MLMFLILVPLVISASLVWSGFVYRFFRDPSEGNGTYTDRHGRVRRKALSLSQVCAPLSRRQAERILALSGSQRRRSSTIRIVAGLLVLAVMVAAVVVLARYGLTGW